MSKTAGRSCAGFCIQEWFILLNIQKCEVMAASSTCNTGSVLCSIGSNDLVAKISVKSLVSGGHGTYLLK